MPGSKNCPLHEEQKDIILASQIEQECFGSVDLSRCHCWAKLSAKKFLSLKVGLSRIVQVCTAWTNETKIHKLAWQLSHLCALQSFLLMHQVHGIRIEYCASVPAQGTMFRFWNTIYVRSNLQIAWPIWLFVINLTSLHSLASCSSDAWSCCHTSLSSRSIT